MTERAPIAVLPKNRTYLSKKEQDGADLPAEFQLISPGCFSNTIMSLNVKEMQEQFFSVSATFCIETVPGPQKLI